MPFYPRVDHIPRAKCLRSTKCRALKNPKNKATGSGHSLYTGSLMIRWTQLRRLSNFLFFQRNKKLGKLAQHRSKKYWRTIAFLGHVHRGMEYHWNEFADMRSAINPICLCVSTCPRNCSVSHEFIPWACSFEMILTLYYHTPVLWA